MYTMCNVYVLCNMYFTYAFLTHCRLWTTGWILNTMSTLCIGGICILKMWQDLYLLAVAVKNISYSFYIPDTMDKWSYHVQCTEIAICSANCVQIWKGRDRKMIFSGWVIKNVELTVRLFYVKPCKRTSF